MRLLRLSLFIWLSLALSGSGWAFVPTDCESTGHEHAATADIATSDGAPSNEQHHGHDHHDLGAGLADADSAPACECCDACVTSCAFSASTMTAQANSLLPNFEACTVSMGKVAGHTPPPAYPLLRPPIPTV